MSRSRRISPSFPPSGGLPSRPSFPSTSPCGSRPVPLFPSFPPAPAQPNLGSPTRLAPAASCRRGGTPEALQSKTRAAGRPLRTALRGLPGKLTSPRTGRLLSCLLWRKTAGKGQKPALGWPVDIGFSCRSFRDAGGQDLAGRYSSSLKVPFPASAVALEDNAGIATHSRKEKFSFLAPDSIDDVQKTRKCDCGLARGTVGRYNHAILGCGGMFIVVFIFARGECTVDIFDEENRVLGDVRGCLLKERIINAVRYFGSY